MTKQIAIVGAERLVGESVMRACVKAGYNVRVYVPLDASVDTAAKIVRGEPTDYARLCAFFAGADMAFVHADFWRHYDERAMSKQDDEPTKRALTSEDAALLQLRDAKLAVDACAAANVGHLYICGAESPLYVRGVNVLVPQLEYRSLLEVYTECRVGRLTSLRLGFVLESLLEEAEHSLEHRFPVPLDFVEDYFHLPVISAASIGTRVLTHWRRLRKQKLTSGERMHYPLVELMVNLDDLLESLESRGVQAQPLALNKLREMGPLCEMLAFYYEHGDEYAIESHFGDHLLTKCAISDLI